MRINKNLSDLHKIIQINTEDFYDVLSFLADLPAELYQQGVAFCEHWLCGLKKELDGFKKEVLQIDQIYESDQEQQVKILLKEIKRESSILWANLFTEHDLSPHREKELLNHRDKHYKYLGQIEKYITNIAGGNHAS